MAKKFCRFPAMIFIVSIFLFLLISCSRSLGYSVVLWSDAEHNLEDGQIVKVHIKSNIFHEYVITELGAEEKFEVPEWQLTAPESKSKAIARAKKFSEFEHVYAVVKLDGLPVRSETVNTSKQVYRLRKDEIIRVLYKGNGQSVSNGKNEMEGEWLRVLTETGTQGWCFSHNLELFTAGIDVKSSVQIASKDDEKEKTDEILENALKKRWYPEEFDSMIKNERIDLEKMNPSFGFDFGNTSGFVTLRTAEDDYSWDFGGISKLYGKQYQLDGTKVNVTIRDENLISVQFFDSNRKIRMQNFVAFGDDFDLSALIDEEKSRRERILSKIAGAGPKFTSSSYGTIFFSDDGYVTWLDNGLIVQQGLVDASIANSARISVEYFLAKSLRGAYDGVLTFTFGGAKKINFFYKLTAEGLRLEDAVHAEVKDGEKFITESGTSALVMFFEPVK
ncbi:MAG: SH3 domain-containing protein [Treponema sp.]|nr:SH3 domain-containing protein [Treponema sp.]